MSEELNRAMAETRGCEAHTHTHPAPVTTAYIYSPISCFFSLRSKNANCADFSLSAGLLVYKKYVKNQTQLQNVHRRRT